LHELQKVLGFSYWRVSEGGVGIMPNPNYLRGRRLEYKVKKRLEDEGYFVQRSAGSKGIDLIAIRHNLVEKTYYSGKLVYTTFNSSPRIRLIDCKAGKSRPTKQDKEKFERIKEITGIEVEVIGE